MSLRHFKRVESLGNMLVEIFHLIALFVIGGTIIWSAVVEYLGMIAQGYADLKDILLLFIYLELGAMVGIYFKTNRLPVRYLLYIAITALTRLLVIDIKTMQVMEIAVVTGAILALTVSILILRFGSVRFSQEQNEE